MQNLRTGNPTIDQLHVPGPGHSTALTTAPESAPPLPDHLCPEAIEAVHVAGDGMIVKVAANDRLQPPPSLGHRVMPSSPQLRLDLLQLRGQALAHRLTLDEKSIRLPSLAAEMRKTQKVEIIRLPLTALLPIVVGVTSKLDEPRFLRVQFQPKLLQPLLPGSVATLGIALMLKTHDDIIGVTDHNDCPSGLLFPPLLDPQVEYVVQVDVRQQRRYNRPLWRTYRRLRPHPVLGYPGPEPFADQTQYPRVGNPMLDKPHQPCVVKRIEKSTNVGIEHPVHRLAHDPDEQRIQCIMRAAPWPESVRKAYEVLFVNLIENCHHCLLNDLVFQRRDAQRPLSSIGFGNIGPLRRLRAIRPLVYSALQIKQPLLQVRLILFDKRGTGLSDRMGDLPNLETRMDDVRAVMDAVGSERAALCGTSEGGVMCALFAATYPARTSGLVMIGSHSRLRPAPDYPWGRSAEVQQQFLETIQRDWGGPVGLDVRAPSFAHDERARQWWARYLRMSASPGAAAALWRMNYDIDKASMCWRAGNCGSIALLR